MCDVVGNRVLSSVSGRESRIEVTAYISQGVLDFLHQQCKEVLIERGKPVNKNFIFSNQRRNNVNIFEINYT